MRFRNRTSRACCSASWHPSLLGHELRADNHIYHLLLQFKDAIEGLLKKIQEGETLDTLLALTKGEFCN